ncbi:polyphosphate kinase [Arthrobacter sp. Hiyo6]|nr:polyphosphate kinase [Arthrobacter sp. Hiyo6]
MQPESAGTATSETKVLPVRARFGSSEVPASRATQDRIDIPEFAPNLEPEGEISPDRFLDRELSWLAFNARVLELAEDPNLFLLERVSFLSIFASNLDEFFMVRVAGLKRRIATGLAVPSPAGLSPMQVLEQIGDAAHRLAQRHARVYAEQIRPALAYEHIHLMHWDELDDQAKDQLSAMFAEKVFPILTPLAVDPAHPFPYISGLSLNLAVVVRNPVSDKELFARVKVPDQLPRLISIDGPRAGSIPGRVARFIALEEVIAVHLDQLFAGMEVLEHHTFRVTRNEDVEVEEDDAENLLQALEKELLRRRFGPPVRLEVTNDINPNIRALLIRELGVEESEVYSVPAPLDLRGLSVIAGIDRADLHYPKHVPHTSRYLNESETAKAANVFAAMRRRDILLHHPYDSFSTSVQAFLEQAASDPKVQAIKQTLYRTSGDSPIVDALIDAAEAGKQVLALVEIKPASMSRPTSHGPGNSSRPACTWSTASWDSKPTASSPSWCARKWTGCGATATSAPATTTRGRPATTRTWACSPPTSRWARICRSCSTSCRATRRSPRSSGSSWRHARCARG